MSTEHPEAIDRPDADAAYPPAAIQDESIRASRPAAPVQNSSPEDVTVVVRGEAVRNQETSSASKESQAQDKQNVSAKEVSAARSEMQRRLPALEDDRDVGLQKDHVVTRDGKADLSFTGTLVASAASLAAADGKWQEYRIYRTNAGKHVFAKVSRSVYAEERDAHTADVFDPSPSSMPSQLLRGARDLVHSKPSTWENAAAEFFGYGPLAKELYRKIGNEFEEHIS